MSSPKSLSLTEAIHATPIVDNHAHPLLKRALHRDRSLLTIATEAHGDALPTSKSSLAHIRAVKQLARLLGCTETWDSVEQALLEKRSDDKTYAAWTARCFNGIESVLVDDGLDSPDDAESHHFLSKFTPSKCKRIVRIEQVVLPLINDALDSKLNDTEAFKKMETSFRRLVTQAINDPEVVAFKSVICYRTGLSIPQEVGSDRALDVFKHFRKECKLDKTFRVSRVDHQGLNDYLVHLLADTLEQSKARPMKPIQFHTGLGDKDITLTKASPAHLQNFIRKYKVPMVLLHSGYPFAREAAYLATMYSHVYVDIGEIFPFLSRQGQVNAVKEITELCPAEKILWSTDGHWYPETYLLAVRQMRETVATVLTSYVAEGDMSESQAIQWVEDVLFNNSNRLYSLNLTMQRKQDEGAKAVAQVGTALKAFNQMLAGPSPPLFLRICWVDLTATVRLKAIPARRVMSLLSKGDMVSTRVAHAGLGLTQSDYPALQGAASGEWNLIADFASLTQGPRKGHAQCFGRFEEDDGSSVPLCPRSILKTAINRAARRDISFLVGLELELVLVRRTDAREYAELDTDGHAWATGRTMEHDAVILVLEEAIDQLEAAGIHIETFHAESAPGQYEVVLPATDPMSAIDALLTTRSVISNCATAKGYRMTLHPKPFPKACGTAAHMHMSLSTPGDPEAKNPKLYEPFYAGVLRYLRNVSAFLYSSDVSYERVIDGVWAGGTWITWGNQNRETPLRKISGSHWEIKCIDGMANPYLAAAAVFHAGMEGIEQGMKLPPGHTGLDGAYMLTDAKRSELGITQQFPKDMEEALEALQDENLIADWMGEQLVAAYVTIKKLETKTLRAMSDKERRQWVIERY